MTAVQLLDELAIAGVVLYLKDGKLKYQADSGAYTDERRAIVAAHREALIAALNALALDGSDAGPVEKSRGADAWPWHHDTRPVPDPEAHYKQNRALFPAPIAPTLEAIAKAWGHTKHKTKLKDGSEQRFEALSLRREYERLAGWAIAEPGIITPAWLAEQEARWAPVPHNPPPAPVARWWRERWAELKEAGYVPGGRVDAGRGSGPHLEGEAAGGRDDGDAGRSSGSPDGAPRQPAPGGSVRTRPARSA